MKAARATGSGVLVTDVPDPTPGAGQVLAAPEAAGICGSDLHLVQAFEGLGDAVTPIVLGHEFCARIVDLGPGTPANLKPGTRVVSVPYADGPDQPEGLGLSPVMGGAFAELIVLQHALLLPVPDDLPSEYAALTEPVAVGVHAVATAAPAKGDVALVIGCGPIGLSVIAALKAGGHGPVIAADFAPGRRRTAERLGADLVLDPAVDSPYGQWEQFGVVQQPPSPLLPPDLGRAGNVVAFECVGVPGVLDAVISGVPRHTRVVVVGVCMTPDQISPVNAILKEVTLSFVYAYRQAEFARTLDLLATGTIDGSAFVTDRIGLDEIPGAFRALHEPGDQVKVIADPQR
ncbi:zinc-binding dehydrogenase [Cryptosporangium aurantiacum]|uniref:2-desacetyl-2-hydroxyethyl bacteriochlorophyllide A dehydrogenase n=1 Tax=Cryptosporangium aurantiacum TaxID=134849 RepID=A0A1M7RAY4_9ACTN|nr:zinc-binding dehydrogenase [Cryptosporangium aurantiacum]SHN43444.1 2-desacetyl-2-hydroxyethyl bacteriochlorophyllide A dehydrogenase [Cryptosporangium aurantiacum]